MSSQTIWYLEEKIRLTYFQKRVLFCKYNLKLNHSQRESVDNTELTFGALLP